MLRRLCSTGLTWSWVSVLLLALDRVTKMWSMAHLTLGEPVKVLPVFNLTLAYNTGAAFGFLNSEPGWQNVFLGGLAVLVSVVVLVWMFRLPVRERWVGIALSLVVGGALGNVWDRVLYGYVIDFLSFHWEDWSFAIFNVADSGICVGAFMLMLHWIRHPGSK
jgi:signal peptidase II